MVWRQGSEQSSERNKSAFCLRRGKSLQSEVPCPPRAACETHRVAGERFARDGGLRWVECSRCAIMVYDGDEVRYLGLVVYPAGCMFRIAPTLGLNNRFRARRPAA